MVKTFVFLTLALLLFVFLSLLSGYLMLSMFPTWKFYFMYISLVKILWISSLIFSYQGSGQQDSVDLRGEWLWPYKLPNFSVAPSTLVLIFLNVWSYLHDGIAGMGILIIMLVIKLFSPIRFYVLAIKCPLSGPIQIPNLIIPLFQILNWIHTL